MRRWNHRRFAHSRSLPLHRVQHDSRGGSEDPHPFERVRRNAPGGPAPGERGSFRSARHTRVQIGSRHPCGRSGAVRSRRWNHRRFAHSRSLRVHRVQHDSRGGRRIRIPSNACGGTRRGEPAPGERGSSDPHATLAFRSDRDHPCGRSGAVRLRRWNHRRFAHSRSLRLHRVQHDSRGGSEDPHPLRTRAADRAGGSQRRGSADT